MRDDVVDDVARDGVADDDEAVLDEFSSKGRAIEHGDEDRGACARAGEGRGKRERRGSGTRDADAGRGRDGKTREGTRGMNTDGGVGMKEWVWCYRGAKMWMRAVTRW